MKRYELYYDKNQSSLFLIEIAKLPKGEKVCAIMSFAVKSFFECEEKDIIIEKELYSTFSTNYRVFRLIGCDHKACGFRVIDNNDPNVLNSLNFIKNADSQIIKRNDN